MTVSRTSSVGVVILAYNAARLLQNSIPVLLASPLQPKVLVVDSSSSDGTADCAKKLGAEILTIPRGDFNHGRTRELGRQALGTDIAVMMTQDAIPVGVQMLANLVRPIAEGIASVSYARQIPHDGAGFFEAFPREFNYPDVSEVRSYADIERYGAYTFFCSDSCAAYSNATLDTIGGFEATLSLEDTIAVAKLLKAGHKLAYCADAIVKHSHDYTLVDEFTRSFDTGYVRSLHKELLFVAGGDERRGILYIRAMLRHVVAKEPLLIPYAIISTGVRFLGYRIGYHGHGLPLGLKRLLSGQKYYWKA